VLHEDGLLHLNTLPEGTGIRGSDNPDDWLNVAWHFPGEGFSIEEAEMRLIRLAMLQANNNVSAAARLLGVNRDFIRYRLGK
jgi:hypothetical protein